MLGLKSQRSLSNLSGIFALALWSMTALLATELIDIPVFQFLGIVLLFSSTATALLITFKKEWKEVLDQPKHVWVLAAIAIFFNQAGYIAAIKVAPAEQAEVIYYLWPILNILLSALLLKDGFSLSHLFGAFFGFAGVYLLVTEGNGLEQVRSEYVLGYLFAFFSALCWSFYSVYSSKANHIPSTVLGLSCSLMVIPCFIIHVMIEESFSLNTHHWGVISLMGFVVMGFALTFWDNGLKGGDIGMLSVLSFMTPIVSVLLLVSFGKAQFSNTLIVACFLVVAGCMFSLASHGKKKKVHRKSSECTKRVTSIHQSMIVNAR